jgi:ribosomal protein L19
LTYCMNVHPGETLGEQIDNVEKLASAVADSFRASNSLPASYEFGLGLRFGANAAAEFVSRPDARKRLQAICERMHLAPFTMNAFPFGVFHGAQVKEEVYRPTWTDPARIKYSADAAMSLALLAPRNITCGSVSTSPLTYKTFNEDIGVAIRNFIKALEKIQKIHETTGKRIILSIEPEPGCYPETTAETIDVVNRIKEESDESLHPYVGVCLDTAHLAVEFENLAESVRRFMAAGIIIGKFQISAALECNDNAAGREALARYVEKTYLHQTVRKMPDGELQFFGDLPAALATEAVDGAVLRSHFHVPIFEEGALPLRSTSALLHDPDFAAAVRESGCKQFEVETYTWNVWRECSGSADEVIPGIVRELDVAKKMMSL